MRRLHSALTVLLALALPGVVLQWKVADAASGPTSLLELQIGDPARKNRQASLVLDAITDTANGQVIAPPELARSLRSTGLLFIGENRTNADFHEVQLRTVRALMSPAARCSSALRCYRILSSPYSTPGLQVA